MTNCYQLALPIYREATYPLVERRNYRSYSGRVTSLLGLAGGGVCPASTVAGAAVRSYRTISPLPVPLSADIGCVVSVALSRGSPRVAVSHHRALSCSDFPPASNWPATARPTFLIDYFATNYQLQTHDYYNRSSG